MVFQRKNSVKISPKNSWVAKMNSYHSDWLESVANYTKETQTTVLDLSYRELGKEEVKFIINFLLSSQVSELNLEGNHLENSVSDLACLITKTKLRKLNVSFCSFTKDDFLQLSEVVEDSQITDLNFQHPYYEPSSSFTIDEARRFVCNLRKSKVSKFDCQDFFHLLPQSIITLCVRAFPHTSVTSLSLSGCEISSSDLVSLFSNLRRSSVTDLDLAAEWQSARVPWSVLKVSAEVLQELSGRLVETKVEKLNLNGVGLDNKKLSSFVEGLIGSKVTDLSIERQCFKSLDPLLTRLKETEIRTLSVAKNWQLSGHTLLTADCLRYSCLASLDLSQCHLSDEQGEELMESVRLSSVTKLNVHQNNFGLLTVKKLADNIKDINLVDLDISWNMVPHEGFCLLGKCLKESKLTRINFKDDCTISCFNGEITSSCLIPFLKLTEGSSVRQVDMNRHLYTLDASKQYMLMNTTLTELRLPGCRINASDVSGLISFLKATITHLDLSRNSIGDDGVLILALGLQKMQVRRLNLRDNLITNQGAKALALSLKVTNLLYLDLSKNEIEDDGFKILAENVKNSFVTELNVLDNRGKRILPVDTVLWQNKILVHKVLTIFRQIAPKTNVNELCFDRNCDLDVFAFLVNCMWLHKLVRDNPRAINVLLEEKSVSLSREQIFKLVVDDFPRQFSLFIACSIEADLLEYIRLLEKAEEMGLSAIVKSFLLNRPVYILDEEQAILHPSAYRLMLKYKQPVCNLDVEPRGVIKIIEYFTEHADVEGARDLIELLQGVNASSKSIG